MKIKKMLYYGLMVVLCFTIGSAICFAELEGEGAEGEYEWITVSGIDVMGNEEEPSIKICVEESIPYIFFNKVGGMGIKNPADESGFPAAAIYLEQEAHDGVTAANLVAKEGDVNVTAVDGKVVLGVISTDVNGELKDITSTIVLDKNESDEGSVSIENNKGAQILLNEQGGVEIILGQPQNN